MDKLTDDEKALVKHITQKFADRFPANSSVFNGEAVAMSEGTPADNFVLPDAETSAKAFAEKRNNKKPFLRSAPLESDNDAEIVASVKEWTNRNYKRGNGKRRK
jgi:hypothetical protein